MTFNNSKPNSNYYLQLTWCNLQVTLGFFLQLLNLLTFPTDDCNKKRRLFTWQTMMIKLQMNFLPQFSKQYTEFTRCTTVSQSQSNKSNRVAGDWDGLLRF